MGTHVFEWAGSASEVIVTGTFDDWSRSIHLTKEAGIWKKQLDLSLQEDSIYYKFFVDGEWKLSPHAKTEKDSSGFENNVLKRADIQTSTQHPTSLSSAAAVAGLTPASTTNTMAGAQPLEKSVDHVPGSFPGEYSVNPIPASAGSHNPIALYPGDIVPDYSTYTSATIPSAVREDHSLKELQGEQSYGVSPLPASAGASNPIKLAPGETVPSSSSWNPNTIGSTVRLDGDSYEKSDSYPGGAVTGMSSAPTTTQVLAGKAPLESSAVPQVVHDSQIKAHQPPEASASPEAVAEKSDVEKELKDKVPEEQASSENSTVYTAAAAGGAAILGGAAMILPSSISNVFSSMTGSTTEPTAAPGETAAAVPHEVAESQKLAQQSPEASANPTAVAEKSAMESELTKEIHATDAGPAATTAGIAGATAVGGAAAVGGVAAASTSNPFAGDVKAFETDPTMAPGASKAVSAASDPRSHPAFATDPIHAGEGGATTTSTPKTPTNPHAAGVKAFETDPVAAAGATTAVAAVAATSVAAFASDPVSASDSKAIASGSKAIAGQDAQIAGGHSTAALPANATTPQKLRQESRDVSPMSKTPVGAGAAGSSTDRPAGWKDGSGPESKTTPAKAGSSTPATPEKTKEEKKKNRRSLLVRIKDKLKHDK